MEPCREASGRRRRATEDKPEIAARVTWAGAGVNLRTGTPTPERIRAGVRRVPADPGYRRASARLATEIAAPGDPVDAIAAAVRELTEPAVTAAADTRR